MLAAGALAASFLGGRALDRVGFDAASSAGLIAFLASLTLAGAILLPGDAMTFSGSGGELYEAAFDDPEEEIYRRLVYWTEQLLDASDEPLRRLARLFKYAMIALFTAITLWAIAIATASP